MDYVRLYCIKDSKNAVATATNKAEEVGSELLEFYHKKKLRWNLNFSSLKQVCKTHAVFHVFL